MSTRNRTWARIWVMAGALAVSSPSEGATPEQRCQGGKNELAGKFAACRAKAERKLALTGETAAYGEAIRKCEADYAVAWAKHEYRAVSGGGACVDVVAENDLRDFVAACMDIVADVARGGELRLDVVTCNGDLATCTSDRDNCVADLAATETVLLSCQDDLESAELCGNGTIDSGEDCDLGTLGGATCESEGFAAGDLACTSGCILDTHNCFDLRFVDNADGTISDKKTGLMWEKKVRLDASMDGTNFQDADNYYRWSGTCSVGGASCQPDATSEAACLTGTKGSTVGCAQCPSGVCNVSGGLGITAWQWLVNLNTVSFGGHNDWRIPSREELTEILDLGTTSPPGVDVAFHSANCGTACADVTRAECACTSSGSHWSALTFARHTPSAWVVFFDDGTVNARIKTDYFHVRAVRDAN